MTVTQIIPTLTPLAPVEDAMPAFANLSTRASAGKVRVTYIVGSLRDGGAERHVLQIIRELDREAFEPSLILMEDVNLERAAEWVEHSFVMNVPQGGNSRWLRRSWSLARAIGATAGRLKAWGCDVVHAIAPGPSILGAVAARMTGIPVVIGSRTSLVTLYRSGGGFASLADRLAFHLADMTIGPSAAVLDELSRLGGCPARRCMVLYNGIDTSRFRPGLPQDWRKKMGWEDDHVVLGMVANFRACKGHSDFVQAAALIAPCHPEARFVMVGADQGLRAPTEQLARNLGVADRTVFVDADPSPEKIFAAIDVYVCTSTSESFGLVLAEAMACGKPVIATAVGGIPEVVLDGQTGLLVPVNSPASVAAAAETLLANRGLRHAMGMRGRERVEEKFSLTQSVKTHEDLYRRLLTKRKRSAKAA